jgi:hypothetical protein
MENSDIPTRSAPRRSSHPLPVTHNKYKCVCVCVCENIYKRGDQPKTVNKMQKDKKKRKSKPERKAELREPLLGKLQWSLKKFTLINMAKESYQVVS